MASDSTQPDSGASGNDTTTSKASASFTPSTPTIKTVTCDPKGDAILVVNESTYIRVSSKVLSVGSPVFRALFDGRFLEGQNLSSTEPPKLSFTEDNVDAMACLCRRLHWLEEPLGPIPIDLMFDLAILADKYDCCGVLNFYTGQITTLLDAPAPAPTKSQQQTLKSLIIAFFAKDSRNFAKGSTTLCLRISGLICIKQLFEDLPETRISGQLMAELIGLYGHLLQLFSVHLASAKVKLLSSDYNKKPVESYLMKQIEKDCIYQGCLARSAANALQAFQNLPINELASKTLAVNNFRLNMDRLQSGGLCLDCFLRPGAVMRYDIHSKESHYAKLTSQDKVNSNLLEEAIDALYQL